MTKDKTPKSQSRDPFSRKSTRRFEEDGLADAVTSRPSIHFDETFFQEDELHGGQTIWFNPEERYRFLDKISAAQTEFKGNAELGRGGFGRVLLALDAHIGRQVALKEILPQFSPDVLRRFMFEARLTGQLDHPGIAPVYEIGRHEDGAYYYTMKLVRGKTLQDAIRECKTLHERLRLLSHFVDVCQAIAYAHSRNVIHRDIKSSNIMIGEYGETVLLDWGIAKVLDVQEPCPSEKGKNDDSTITEVSVDTRDGAIIGTINYMSPEQARGDSDRIDRQSDVWSLGAVLYEILTGIPPYSEVKGMKTLDLAQKGEVASVRAVGQNIPAELAAVVEKSLKASKAERYGSAMDLADDVEAFRFGYRVTAYEYSSWELVRKFVARNPRLSALLIAFFVTLVLSSGMIFNAYRHAETARQQERSARIDAQFNLSLAHSEKAARDLEEINYLGATVNSALALAHNPFNPHGNEYSLNLQAGTKRLKTDDLLLSQSLFFLAWANRAVSYQSSLEGHSDTVYDLEFSPDSKWLASAGRDKAIVLRNMENLKEAASLPGHKDNVVSIAFSPDSRYLASAGRDWVLLLWDVEKKKEIRRFDKEFGEIICLAFSPAGDTLASGAMDGTISIRKAPGMELEKRWQAHGQAINAMAFSPAGSHLATASKTGKIKVWSIPEGKIAAMVQGHQGQVDSVIFSPDGQILASSGADAVINVWRATDLRLLGTLKGHEDEIFNLAFSSDGRILASASRDRTIKIWNIEEKECINTLKGAPGEEYPWTAIDFSKDGTKLASAGYGSSIVLWRLDKDRMFSLDLGGQDLVVSGKIDRKNRYLASTGKFGVNLWSLADHRLAGNLKEPDNSVVWSAAFSPDGSWLFTAGTDGIIRKYDPQTRSLVSQWPGHDGWVLSLAYAEQGNLLASAGKDGAARVWYAKTGEPLAVFKEHAKDGVLVDVMAVAFSPDGRAMASGGKDNGIVLYDLVKKLPVMKLQGHTDWVTELAFSPDGQTLLSSGKDGSIKLWDSQTGGLIRTFAGHTMWVNDAGFSPDGARIISGSDDQTLRVWNARTGEETIRLRLSNEITFTAFSPDGKSFAFNDGTRLKVYPADFDVFQRDPREILKEAEKLAGINPDANGKSFEPSSDSR